MEKIRSYPLEDNYLVHSTQDSKLYILNETGHFILERLGAGRTIPEIVWEMTEAYGIEYGTAGADIALTLKEWRRIGLMPGVESCSPPETRPGNIPPHRLEPLDALRYYRLPGFHFSLRYNHAAMERLCHPRLSAIETDNSEGVDSELAIQTDGTAWTVTVDGREACRTVSSNEARIELMIAILKGYHPDLNILALIHAAVVGRNGRAILLPAPSRCGKSTITAALVHAGYGYLSDDMAVLDLASGSAYPFPLGLSLRAGSWPIAEGMFPGLRGSSSAPLSDEMVKVIMLEGAQTLYAPLPVTAVVFPAYGSEQSNTLHKLSMTEMMVELSAAGFWTPLHADHVARLLDLLHPVQRFRLEYSSLEAAVELMEALPP